MQMGRGIEDSGERKHETINYKTIYDMRTLYERSRMKHSIILVLLSISLSVNAQSNTSNAQQSVSMYESKVDSLLSQIDTLMMINNDWLEHLELDHSLKNRFKLYQTDNIYTLLQLDTKTGKIDQVQWSLDSDNEGSVSVNSDDLSIGNYGSCCFELYPTQNMYQFILLDKTNGRKWHVQWGTENGKRWIRKIY